MSKRTILFLIAVLLLVVIPASASSTTQVCQDKDFIKTLGKDQDAISAAFKVAKPADPLGEAQQVLALAELRQKYEDLHVTPECAGLQFRAVLAFANASDMLTLDQASKLDTKTGDKYTKALVPQNDRFQAALKNIRIEAGVETATPAK